MSKKLRELQQRFIRYKRIRLPRRIRRFKLLSRHPFAVPVITFAVLILATATGLFLTNRHHAPKAEPYVVIVSHDHGVQTVPSREPTVGTLLAKLHITLHQGDIVEPGLPTHINQDKFRINIYRAVPVEIIDGAQHYFTFSAATTGRSVVKQAGISAYAEDQITTTPVTSFSRQLAIGETVAIKRSVPVSLILYGTPIPTRSHSDTVGQMLQEKHISLRHGDTVQPSLATPISPNQQIFVLHEGTKIVTETQSVPAPVQTIDDPKLSSGTSAIRQQGAPGALLITYQVDEKTGARIQLQSALIQPPIPEIVARGTAPVSGSLATWLYKLRQCESGGNYQDNTGNGYYGAYQFSLSTWHRVGYSGLPSDAAPADQDAAIVKNTNLSSGGIASQNPGCYYRTGISAYPPGS